MMPSEHCDTSGLSESDPAAAESGHIHCMDKSDTSALSEGGVATARGYVHNRNETMKDISSSPPEATASIQACSMPAAKTSVNPSVEAYRLFGLVEHSGNVH